MKMILYIRTRPIHAQIYEIPSALKQLTLFTLSKHSSKSKPIYKQFKISLFSAVFCRAKSTTPFTQAVVHKTFREQDCDSCNQTHHFVCNKHYPVLFQPNSSSTEPSK